MRDLFSNLLKANDTHIVELCHAKSRDGRDLYAFIRMSAKDHARYHEEIARGLPINLNTFGVILHTGWGTKPSPEIAADIMQNHTDNTSILDAMMSDQRAIQRIIKKEPQQGEKE